MRANFIKFKLEPKNTTNTQTRDASLILLNITESF